MLSVSGLDSPSSDSIESRRIGPRLRVRTGHLICCSVGAAGAILAEQHEGRPAAQDGCHLFEADQL
jgi:hypothetical protein